jgi:hydroxymethylglutaryl-CoA lyase
MTETDTVNNDMPLRGLPREISVFEVGPRDGLQNEREFIPTETKVEFVNRLTQAGCKKIEVTSFVHPRWVPQLRDAAEVYAQIEKSSRVTYSALIPNLKGLELAAQSGFPEVVTILSASESHNKNNINRTVTESLAEIKEINRVAAQCSIRVRSYIATSFGCPFEGSVNPDRVLEIAKELERSGSYEVALGDTTGMANPLKVYTLCRRILNELNQASLAVHLHQSDGIEFANVLAALQAGVTTFDSAAGGLGGCPYAPGALGNIATEVLVELFTRMGINTGIDPVGIGECGQFALKSIGR